MGVAANVFGQIGDVQTATALRASLLSAVPPGRRHSPRRGFDLVIKLALMGFNPGRRPALPLCDLRDLCAMLIPRRSLSCLRLLFHPGFFRT
jgi:hypothetical protein